MSITVLVVDDDEVLGQVLCRILRNQGFQVRRAANVADALTVAAECQPRIALLDLCLPDGTGLELAPRLRAEHEDLMLILMTAYPLRLQEHPELETDFARVLIKPLDLAELRHALESLASLT